MKTFIVVAASATVLCASACFAMDKDVEYAGGGAGKVVFSHKTHTQDAGFADCKICHNKTAGFRMGRGMSPMMNMSAMKAGKSCGACHNGKQAFDASSPDNCGNCHSK